MYLRIIKFVLGVKLLNMKSKVTVTCPSNIALIKYWGKKNTGIQIPQNPSISWSLSDLNAKTTVQYRPGDIRQINFSYDGLVKESFLPKINEFFNRIEEILPWVKNGIFNIDTVNNFPHGTGIASSAAGFGALATALVELENKLNKDTDEYWNKVSEIARLGSGSACRSMYSKPAIWGAAEAIQDSSDYYAVELKDTIHPSLQNWKDCVLIIDSGEKKVSSTVGHSLLNGHAYAEARFLQANKNLIELIQVLKNGNVDRFIKIVESEALQLHSMMMSSIPYYMLMRPNTVAVIEEIWNFREVTKLPLCFTLDAGANVHLLYDKEVESSIKTFIDTKLLPYCQNATYLCSGIGGKPQIEHHD